MIMRRMSSKVRSKMDSGRVEANKPDDNLLLPPLSLLQQLLESSRGGSERVNDK